MFEIFNNIKLKKKTQRDWLTGLEEKEAAEILKRRDFAFEVKRNMYTPMTLPFHSSVFRKTDVLRG